MQPRADASHMGAEIFSDVGKGEWYYSYVSWVMNKGIMTGMGDGSFAPSEALSRAQFATVLWRMSGSPDVAYTKTYRDVPDGQFYTKPVLWASQSEVGIITGYGDGKFGPADLITREQMATMLYRYTKYKKLETEKPAKLDRFPDAGSVNDFAKDAVQWAVAVQMIQGDNKKLNPQGATSRAVCATMIERFSEKHMPGAFADIEIYGRVKDIAVGSADAATGAFDVTFYGLETSFPVKKLETAVWCADDKSDIQWYTAEKIGNGNWRFEGNVREHQYHFGTYKFESSVLLSNGLRLRLGSKEAWFEGSVAQMRVNGHVNNILNETGWDLYNAYWWVASHVTYKTLPIHVEPPEGYTRDQWYALMAYEEGQGNCFVYAAAFYQLAKGLGYDVEYVEGQVGMAAGGYGPHGWTVIHLDGASYICDPEAQYEVGGYNFYMQPIGNTIFNYVW